MDQFLPSQRARRHGTALSLLCLDLLSHAARAQARPAMMDFPRPLGVIPGLATFPPSYPGIYEDEQQYAEACFPEARAWVREFFRHILFKDIPAASQRLTAIAEGELGRTLTPAESRLVHRATADVYLEVRGRQLGVHEGGLARCTGCGFERAGTVPVRVTFRPSAGGHTETHRYCPECKALADDDWTGMMEMVAEVRHV